MRRALAAERVAAGCARAEEKREKSVNDAAKKRARARAEKKAKAAKAKAEADAKANCDMLGIAYDENGELMYDESGELVALKELKAKKEKKPSKSQLKKAEKKAAEDHDKAELKRAQDRYKNSFEAETKWKGAARTTGGPPIGKGALDERGDFESRRDAHEPRTRGARRGPTRPSTSARRSRSAQASPRPRALPPASLPERAL